MITFREINEFLRTHNYIYENCGDNTIIVFRQYLDLQDVLILGKFCISDKDPYYDHIYGYSKNQTQEERNEINGQLLYNLYLDSISFPMKFGKYLSLLNCSQFDSFTKFCKCPPTRNCDCHYKMVLDHHNTPNNHCTQYCREFLSQYLNDKDLHIDVILEEKYQDKFG